MVEEDIGRGDKRDVGGITEMNRLFLLGLMPLILLLVVPHNAFAWDFGSLFNGFQGQGQGFHHWGFDNYGQGSGQFGCGAYCQGERDAIYDHTQGLVYNPTPACCHSEYYQQTERPTCVQFWKWTSLQSQSGKPNYIMVRKNGNK